MSSDYFSQFARWISRPEVYGTLLGIVLPLALTPFLLLLVRRSRAWAALHSVDFFLFDVDQRFVHIIGEHRYMPDDGDSYSVYHHRLLDRMNGKIYQGGHQQGNKIDLDSDFLQRTKGVLEAMVKQKLSFEVNSSFSTNSWSDEVKDRPACTELPWLESDTERPKLLPDFGVVFRELHGSSDKFSVEVRSNGKRQMKHEIKGSVHGRACLYDKKKSELLFLYGQGMFSRVGICIVEMASGKMILQRLVKPDVTPS